MGIVAFKWAEGNNNQLTLVMKRDNWETRVISGASWNGNGEILSGRCADNGGTWFGISRGGRVAFLVSAEILLDRIVPHAGSELYPIEFLEGNMTPEDFGNGVAHREQVGQLLSFSLIVADLTLNSMIHVRKPLYELEVKTEIVPFGVHTLSPFEGLVTDATEPMDLRLEGFFNRMIGYLRNNILPLLEDMAEHFLNAEGGEDDAVFRDIFDDPASCHHQLVSLFLLNSIQLGMERIGTTSTTALAVERSSAAVFERYRHNGGWHMQSLCFQIQH